MKYLNITESTLLKSLPGILRQIFINSHTSGTIKVIDGKANGAAASGVLTSTGAMVPADYATNTLTSDATAVAEGATVTIGTRVYTAKTAFTPGAAVANEVLIGSTADGSAFLANLKKAINGTGTPGVEYSAGTTPNTDVVADTLTATTLKVWARTLGTTPNAFATTETSTHLSWADTTLGGGTGASDPGVTAAGATFTIGTRTYTAVLRLAESIGMDSVADQVLWITSEAVFLDNIKSAINGAGLPGTDYSTATTPNADVIATTNTNTAQTFVARKIGTAGNALATTETMANYAFGGALMTGGTGTNGKVMHNTITLGDLTTSDDRRLSFGDEDFSTALLVVIGGTADITVAYD